MLLLTDEQIHALQQTEFRGPINVVDPASNSSFVIVRSDVFEKLCLAMPSYEIDKLYSLLANIEPGDWEDAAEYQDSGDIRHES